MTFPRAVAVYRLIGEENNKDIEEFGIDLKQKLQNTRQTTYMQNEWKLIPYSLLYSCSVEP
jgi:hypothetical protein